MRSLTRLRAVMAALIVTLGLAYVPFAAPLQGVGPTAALAAHRHCTWQWRHHHRVRVCYRR